MRRAKQAAYCCALALCSASLPGADWPQFRGPQSHGVSPETGLPLEWSATTNVRWKTALPGPGHSSPIVWGNRIFLTAGRADRSLTRYLFNKSRLSVLCLDKNSGRVMWEREVHVGPLEELHATNAAASPTPVTDGKYVYVYFGSKGLFAFDFDGNKIWEASLGPFPNEWGSASSPVLYNNLLLLNSDTDGEDFLLAVDKNTGKTVWKTSRNGATRSWPTAYVWNAAGRDEIVVSGSERVKSYNPKDGRELWSVEGLTKWVTPTPVSAHGMLYVASNGPGGNVIMALQPGGKVAWTYTKNAPYSSSLLVVGDYLYGVRNGGVMVCLNAKTGVEQWIARMSARGAYYASPVAVDGRIYTLSEDGEVTVLAPGPKFQVLATSAMGERCMASPAISDGRFIIRSDANLYSIGK